MNDLEQLYFDALRDMLERWVALDEALDEPFAETEELWKVIDNLPELSDMTRRLLGARPGECLARWRKIWVTDAEDFAEKAV